ncbi:MAG: MarR family transcriptional regulator [Cytophagaceae bacterium]|nr:MarR family transcriptional regulator [Cytophagaceae bacterium]
MKHTPTICSHIKFAWLAIARMYNEEASKHGMSISVGYVLLNIDKQYGTPATKIAPALGMEATSLSRILKNLEEDGLIYRKQDGNDRRLVKVFLTDKGKEAKEVAKKVVKKFNEVIRQEIPETKLQIFTEVIEKISSIVVEKNIY